MKRSIAVIMSIIMITGVLTACDYEGDSSASESMRSSISTSETTETETIDETIVDNEIEQQEETYKQVQICAPTTDLYIRKGAGMSYTAIYVASKGEQLELTGNVQIDSEIVWYEVVIPSGETGWCSGKYLSIDEEIGMPMSEESMENSSGEVDGTPEEEESEPDSLSADDTSTDIITVENNEDLYALINSAYVDAEKQAEFVRKYKGKTIEIDCVVLGLKPNPYAKHGTIWSFVLAPGEDKESIGAALFMLKDMNMFRFKWDEATRPESLTIGSKIRIRAEVIKEDDPLFIYLEPVCTWGR